MATDDRNVDDLVDEVLLAALPAGGKVIDVFPLGLSNWCDTNRIDVGLPDGTVQRFFEKRAKGEGGLELTGAHWVAETSIHRFIPEYTPRPVAAGDYKKDPDTHFYLAEFVDMINDDIPAAEAYMAPLAALNVRSMGHSPTGKFGFPVTTCFADMPQSNDWEASWEVWWTRHMRFVIAREEGLRGPHSPENAQVVQDFINIVLPRYLRPLESEGRSLQPCLCHTNAWPGNVKYRLDNETAVIFDSNALWAHAEMELGLIRNPRYPLGKPYIKDYWKSVPISEPEEDADSRIIMYTVRHQVCIASVFPKDENLRNIFLANMKLLVSRAKEDLAVSEAGDED